MNHNFNEYISINRKEHQHNESSIGPGPLIVCRGGDEIAKFEASRLPATNRETGVSRDKSQIDTSP